MVIVHKRSQGQHVRSAKSKKLSSLVRAGSWWLLEMISHTANKSLLSVHINRVTKDRPSKTFVEMRHCFEEAVFKACCFSGNLSLLCNINSYSFSVKGKILFTEIRYTLQVPSLPVSEVSHTIDVRICSCQKSILVISSRTVSSKFRITSLGSLMSVFFLQSQE